MQSGMEFYGSIPKTYSARVDSSGRIVLPVELRERLHVATGDQLVLQEHGGTVSLKSYDQVLADAQAYFSTLAPPGVSLVDELLADRRAEVAREAARDAETYD